MNRRVDSSEVERQLPSSIVVFVRVMYRSHQPRLLFRLVFRLAFRSREDERKSSLAAHSLLISRCYAVN